MGHAWLGRVVLIDLANSIIELKCDFGKIRTLQVADIHPGYIAGLNDPDVNRYLVAVAEHEQTEASVSEFVRHSFVTSNEMLFGLWLENSAQHCGTVRLHGIDWKNRAAHIGVCLFDQSCRGKGVGAAAVIAVTKWAIEHLGLRWIEAGVYRENIASLKMFERIGYDLKYVIDGKYLYKGEPAVVNVYAADRHFLEMYE